MRALAIFFLLSWALIASGAWLYERGLAGAARTMRDRALQACEATE